MNKRIARGIISLCDFMNGYIGQEIERVVICAIIMVPVSVLMALVMILLS